ncbi:MAG TPA: glycosyltransferase family 39 protein [Microlunatus sp.]|nr:glycosyltransferase family 39 protein [Microlunatus sp.]
MPAEPGADRRPNGLDRGHRSGLRTIGPRLWTSPPAARLLVIVVGVVMLAIKVWFAGSTMGTTDAFYWTAFADAVRQVGPIRIYSFFPDGGEILYNHPPVSGYWLWFLNGIESSFGPSIRFLVRVTASLADLVTTIVVFEMIRRRQDLPVATTSALLVAMSPVLLIISGFHANTDPVFMMLVILAAYLLVDRSAPLGAGVALGLAFGVKIVPVVVVPLFLVWALIAGRRVLLRFAATLVLVVLITWAPALIEEWDRVTHNVIGYAGISVRQWGLPQIVTWLGNPDWATALMTGPWRYAALLIGAGVPAWLVWRRPAALPAALGIALGLLLALSPAFGHQYLVWPAAGLFFVSLVGGALYNLAAGLLIAVVYTRWNGGFPWDTAWGSPMTQTEVLLAFAVWVLLLAVVVRGIVAQVRQPAESFGLTERLTRAGYLRPSAR